MILRILILASFLIALPAGVLAATDDQVELWQNFDNGTAKGGYFQLKINGASGWVDAVKDDAGRRQKQSDRLQPQQVQGVFASLRSMGFWTVAPKAVDKDSKTFVYLGKIKVREAGKKREINYQIDKEYYVSGGQSGSLAGGLGLETKTDLGKIDRYLSQFGAPLREPINRTP